MWPSFHRKWSCFISDRACVPARPLGRPPWFTLLLPIDSVAWCKAGRGVLMRAVYPCLYGHTPGFLPPAIFGQLSTLTWRRNNVVSSSPPGGLGGADNRSIYWKQRRNNSLYSSALLWFSLRWNIFLQHVSKWFLMDKGFVFWTSAIWWWITLTWLLIQSINATRDVIPGTS